MPLIELGIGKNILHAEPPSSEVGSFGEKIAADYLRRRGFQLVASNFKVTIGRNRKGVAVTGEIDLIAVEDQELCFVEVKTRSNQTPEGPFSAIDLRKQRQIIRTAKVYRRIFAVEDVLCRFDAIGIVLSGSRAPKIELRRSFFDESKFRKKAWHDEFI